MKTTPTILVKVVSLLSIILWTISCSTEMEKRINKYEKEGKIIVAFGNMEESEDDRWRWSEKPYVVYLEDKQVYLDLIDTQQALMKTDEAYPYLYFAPDLDSDYPKLLGYTENTEMTFTLFHSPEHGDVDCVYLPSQFDENPEIHYYDGFGLFVDGWDSFDSTTSKAFFYDLRDSTFYLADEMRATYDSGVELTIRGSICSGENAPALRIVDPYTAEYLTQEGWNDGVFNARNIYLTEKGIIVNDDSYAYFPAIEKKYQLKDWASLENYMQVARDLQFKYLSEKSITVDDVHEALNHYNAIKGNPIRESSFILRAEVSSIDYSRWKKYKYDVTVNKYLFHIYTNDDTFAQLDYPTTVYCMTRLIKAPLKDYRAEQFGDALWLR